MKTRSWLIVMFLIVALFVLSCAPTSTTAPTSAPASQNTVAATSAPSVQPTSAPTTAAAATAKPVRHLVYGSPVTPPNLVHMGPYVAQELGYFKDVALDVEFKSFEGGVGALRGLIAGGLDVVGTSSDPLFLSFAQGGVIHAIGAYAPKLSVVMMGTPDVKAPADLKGKKMGIQDVGGVADVVAEAVMRSVRAARTLGGVPGLAG